MGDPEEYKMPKSEKEFRDQFKTDYEALNYNENKELDEALIERAKKMDEEEIERFRGTKNVTAMLEKRRAEIDESLKNFSLSEAQ